MEKQPFDENGLEQLLIELYALSDEELHEHASAFLFQPKIWINGHFTLTEAQQNYLDDMPLKAAAFLGQQGAFAMENRLDITLSKNHQPQDDKPKQDKWFTTRSSLMATSDTDGQTTASGTLDIQIIYYDQPAKS